MLRPTFHEPLPDLGVLPRSPRLAPAWGKRGRQIDRRFSEVLFLERAVLLLVRLFEAAPHKATLSTLSPYATPAVVHGLSARFRSVAVVRGITVGQVKMCLVAAEGEHLLVRVRLHLNRHVQLRDGRETSFYSHEEWTFARAIVDAVDRDEAIIDRFGCPGCGSALDNDAPGRCVHCQTVLRPGGADWAVSAVVVLTETTVGPLLTHNVQEMGTRDATVKDTSVLDDANTRLGVAEHQRLRRRAREIFTNLQQRWSLGDLDGLRPFETDALFQSHRFWLEEYQRQGLRNVIDNLVVGDPELCRVVEDGVHLVAVLRIGASCTDATLDANNATVAGSTTRRRLFTEYWTFVKHKDAPGSASMTTCPGCGAPLAISQAGICTSCQRKVTLGRFDWVVSRIEQDEDVFAG